MIECQAPSLPASLTSIPAEHCYFAVLDASVLPRSRRRSARHLHYLLESMIPLPVEEVHAAYAPLADDRVLACAVPREVMDRIDPATARRVVPASIPSWVGAEPERLPNLRFGAAAPPTIHRLRRAAFTVALLGLVAGAALALLRIESRRRSAERVAQIVQQRAAERLTAVLGRLVLPDLAPLAAAEIELLRRGEDAEKAGGATDADALRMLEEIERVWPKGAAARILAINVTGARVAVEASTPDHATGLVVQHALSKLPLWSLRAPRGESDPAHGGTWRFSWVLERQGAGAGGES